MQFLIDFYVIIIGIGIFFIFSLIGYLVETVKKNNSKTNNEVYQINPDIVEDVLIEKKEVNKVELPKENIIVNKGDELLEIYDNDSNN